MIAILVINPNSSASMTEDLRRYVGAEYASRAPIQLEFETGPLGAPPSIDGLSDGTISASCYISSPTAKIFTKDWDAVVVACYSPHPLVAILREKIRAPVVGIFESSITTALHLGRTFAIVTTGKKWEGILADGVKSFGIDSSKCVGIRGTGLGVLELGEAHSDGAEGGDRVLDMILDASLELIEKSGAEVIVLGCAGMAQHFKSLSSRLSIKLASANLLPEDFAAVSMVDGVRAGIETAISLAQIRLSTSNVGTLA